MLQGDSSGSLPTSSIPRGGVDVHQRTPTYGCFQIQSYIGETFHLLNIPCNVGEGWVEFITNNSQKIRGKAIPMVVLVKIEWEKETWAWWPPFAATLKPSGGLWSALCPMSAWLSGTRCGCNEEVHQLTLSPTGVLWFPLPRCDHSLWGCFICPIPTGLVMPMQATPLLQDWGGPATGGGRGRVKDVSLLPGGLVEKLWGRALPVWSNTTIGSPIASHPHWEEAFQTEEGPGFHLALKQLQCISQAKVQLEWVLAHEVEGLTRKYEDQQIRLARKHKKQRAQMAEEADTAFQEVFSETSSADLVKLLPWYISSAVPLCYMNEVLATAALQREDVPATTTKPKLECLQALAPRQFSSSNLDSISSSASLRISPLLALPQLDAHLPDSLLAPCRKSGTVLPAACSVINTTNEPMLTPKWLRLGVNTALQRAMRICPNCHWRLDPALNHKGRNLPVQPRPLLIWAIVQWWEPQGVLGIRTVRVTPTTVGPYLTQTHPERMWLTQIWSQPLGLFHMFRHRWGNCQSHPKEV